MSNGVQPKRQANNEEEAAMRIAAVTEDGITISQHFGRAPYYLVVTVENGKIVGRERRDKMGHAHPVR